MTALAQSRHVGFTVGLAGSAAGPAAETLARMTLEILESLKSRVRAGSALAFQDLRLLASEQGFVAGDSAVFRLAERFLLALPSHLPVPELALDTDGEVVFDWAGSAGQMCTITLRADGRLTYAARLSAQDKDYGTKYFVDAIPKQVVELVQQVTAS